jgi:hypothetical protein
VGARPHRSIKLRRTRDTGGTTAEYLRLLITVLLLFALQATMAETPVAVFVQLLVAGSALILALRVADAPERMQRYIGLLVVVALGGALVQIVQGHSSLANGSLLLINGLLVAAGPVVLFGGVRRHPNVSVKTLIAALTIYVLIGLFFAFVYRAFLDFDEGSFSSATELTPAAMQYFSFITMTTVGFGDITPVDDLVRTVVALEALIGQVYLVTVVALVVANIGATRIAGRRSERGDTDS